MTPAGQTLLTVSQLEDEFDKFSPFMEEIPLHRLLLRGILVPSCLNVLFQHPFNRERC